MSVAIEQEQAESSEVDYSTISLHTDPFAEIDEDDPVMDNHIDLCLRLCEKIRAGEMKMSRWTVRAQKSYSFLRGDQAPKEAGDIFWVVLNLIIHRILTKCGILTAGKPIATVVGRDDDDTGIARAFKDLIEFNADNNDMNVIVQDAVMDMLICGLGILDERWNIHKERYNPEYQAWVPGVIEISKADATKFVFDPENAEERMDGKGSGEWVASRRSELRGRLAGMYPAKSVSIMQAPAKEHGLNVEKLRQERLGGGTLDDSDPSDREPQSDDIMEVTEFWYRKYKPITTVWRVYDDGKRELARRYEADPETGERVEGEPLTPEEVPDVPDGLGFKFKVLTRMKEEMWVCEMCGNGIILFNRKSEYSHGRWPFIFFSGMLHRGEPVPYGEVDRVLEMQDLINSMLSLQIDNAQRTSNTTRLFKRSKVKAEYRNNLEEHLAMPGGFVEVEDTANFDDVVHDVRAPELSKETMSIVNLLVQFFDEVSNVSMVQRGGMPYETSGKGIERLLQAGDTGMENLKNNIGYALTRWGKNHIRNLQQFMTMEEAWRISDDVRESYQLALENYTDPNTMETKLSMVQYQDGEEPVRLLDDFASAHFDVKVVIGSSTERSKEDKLERATFLHERGLYDDEALAEEFDVPREVLKRAQEKNKILQTGQMVEELSEKSPELGALLSGLMTQTNSVLPIVLSALEAQGYSPQQLAGQGQMAA
jgi:hypothetical protein